jgi:hypothetical protein
LKRYFDLIKHGTINAGIEGLLKIIQCNSDKERTVKKVREIWKSYIKNHFFIYMAML